MSESRLEGRVAIVTGGARGIGRAVVEKMLSEGANVVVADVRKENLQLLAQENEAKKNKLICIEVDISEKDQVNEMVDKSVKRFGGVDILVNNAGIVIPSSVENATATDWHTVVNVNLVGSHQCLQAVLPSMKKKKYGKIVNIGSRAALGKVDRTVYSATKAGVIGMTRSWALELAKYNINVNCVSPGGVATELFEQVNPKGSKNTKRIVDGIPLKRMGTPRDVADVITFLSSDEAGFITGQNIYICGGLSIGSY